MSKLDPRSLERIEISQLQPDSRNARTHSKHQIEQISASIKRFGFTAPVLIDEDDKIIAVTAGWPLQSCWDSPMFHACACRI